MRYKCIVAYDGNNYVGFQSQTNGVAIQDVIEAAIKKITNQELRIIMSSRTDSGVHAYGQVFHFDIEREYQVERLKYSLNSMLPEDIHIMKIEIVDESFHARFSVKSKKYEYLINTGEENVFLNHRAYQCRFKLDFDKMVEASKVFLGEHDFGSFNTSPYDLYPDQVRTIYSLELTKDKDVIKVEIVGSGFLRNMVRLIVGTLVEVGRGKRNKEEVIKMLEEPNKNQRRYNIDPNGLYLVEIYY